MLAGSFGRKYLIDLISPHGRSRMTNVPDGLRERDYMYACENVITVIENYCANQKNSDKTGWSEEAKLFLKQEIESLKKSQKFSLKKLQELIKAFSDSLCFGFAKIAYNCSGECAGKTMINLCDKWIGYSGESKELKTGLMKIYDSINPFNPNYILDDFITNYKKINAEYYTTSQILTDLLTNPNSNVYKMPLKFLSDESRDRLFDIAYDDALKQDARNILNTEKSIGLNLFEHLLIHIVQRHPYKNIPPENSKPKSRQLDFEYYIMQIDQAISKYKLSQGNPAKIQQCEIFLNEKIAPLRLKCHLAPLLELKNTLHNFITDVDGSSLGKMTASYCPAFFSQSIGATGGRLAELLKPIDENINPYAAKYVAYDLQKSSPRADWQGYYFNDPLAGLSRESLLMLEILFNDSSDSEPLKQRFYIDMKNFDPGGEFADKIYAIYKERYGKIPPSQSLPYPSTPAIPIPNGQQTRHPSDKMRRAFSAPGFN